MKRILACVSMMLVMAVGAMAAGTVRTPSCGSCGGSPTYQNYGPWQTGSGGEFTLIVVTGTDINLAGYSNLVKDQGGTSSSFQTFCIEENETIYPNTTSGYTIDPYAQNGGVGGAVNGQDYISQGTAWLYSQFAHGTLAYNYANTGGGRYTDAGLLQQAFWYLENEISLPATNNKYIDAVALQFGQVGDTTAQKLARAQANDTGAYGVAALNIFDPSNGNKQQTQLVLVPDAGFTAGLLGLGLAGLGVISRKFRQS